MHKFIKNIWFDEIKHNIGMRIIETIKNILQR